ncbi:hypothetical protein H8D83_02335 [Candidatus Woesearchaeota archaeon]|nr:hypothetical protein [Candidatus Woesearchaeota archaeon]MBL7051231.1 hypothetical protein [Candidatus Woesearchaeota archaeon]
MGLFKKSEETTASPTEGTPTDQVINLRGQGLTDNQVIQALQKDGFASDQIFNAMSQADIKGGIESAPTPIAPEAGGTLPPPPGAPQEQGINMPPPPQEMPMSAPPAQGYAPTPGYGWGTGSGTERIEEIAEAIIDEKWNVLVKDINKIVEWKDEMDSKITTVEGQVNDLKEDFDKLHKAIISKIDEYDKNLTDVGSEIKAMNQVFEKVLPTFTENINELSRITKKLSPIKSKEK